MFQRFVDDGILTAFSLLYSVAVGVLRWRRSSRSA